MLVRILTDEDGDRVRPRRWHYVHVICGSNAALCTGEYFGVGESSATFKTKDRGKITCEECRKIIKEMKAIRL